MLIQIAIMLHFAMSCLKLFNRQKTKNRIGASFKLRWALAVKYLVILPVIFFSAAIYHRYEDVSIWLTIGVMPDSQRFGAIVIIASVLIKACAYLQLGKNWSALIAVYDKQTLTTTGLYRFVRLRYI